MDTSEGLSLYQDEHFKVLLISTQTITRKYITQSLKNGYYLINLIIVPMII